MRVEKKVLKALHLASFSGNTGDCANHRGFYNKIAEHGLPFEFVELEIRRFYKNRGELKFDDSFADAINQYDLLILGGGGFFDLKWDYSSTGTTIDFSPELIEKINIPVLVNAMGYHEYAETTEEHVGKFKKFLEIITKRDNWLISVRNDGSYERMNYRYKELMDSVRKVPDAGFFFNPGIYDRLGLTNTGTTWIGMSLTNELFNKDFNNGITPKDFNVSITEWINDFLDKNDGHNIILFPHANHDIPVISAVLNILKDVHKRERIIIAPLVNKGESIGYVYDLYRICSCVIGMRFHANVCAMAMNVPSIGLAGHEQISSLYNELGFSERCVKVDMGQFGKNLFSLLEQTMNENMQIKKEYSDIMDKLNNESDMYIGRLKEWIVSF